MQLADDVGAAEHLLCLALQRVDDLLWRARRCKQPDPAKELVAGNAGLGHCRHLGWKGRPLLSGGRQELEPAGLQLGITPGGDCKATSICPASRAIVTGPVPL